MYQPTAQDFRIIQQRIQDVYLRIEVFSYNDFLNDDFSVSQTVLEGKIISDDYSFDVDSDIRRTYNITLSVSPEYDMFNIEKVFWLNKILKITCGTYDLEKLEKVEYNLGIYTFTNFIYTVDQGAYTVQINCVDLVAFLNGQINGQLPALGTTVPAYDTIENYGEFDIKYEDSNNETITYYWITKEIFEDIIESYDEVDISDWTEYNQFLNEYDTQHYDIYDGTVSTFEDTKGHWINKIYCYWYHTVQEVLCDLLKGLGYVESKYINTISNDPINEIPHDLEFGTGVTYWEIFVGLRDLYPAYEIYFNVDGKFVYKKIPIDVDEDNALEKENFKSIIINESLNENVVNVRNITRIWGQVLDTDTYITANSGITSNSNYTYVITNNKTRVPFVLEAPATTSVSNVFYYLNNRKYACSNRWGIDQFILGKYYYIDRMSSSLFELKYVNSPILSITNNNYSIDFAFNYNETDPSLNCFFIMNKTIQNTINQVNIKWNNNSNSIRIKAFSGTNIDNYKQLNSNYFTSGDMYLFNWNTRAQTPSLYIIKLTNSNLISTSNAVVIPYTTSDTYTLKDGMSLGITFDNAPTAESYIILNNSPYHFYASSNSLIGYDQLVSNVPYVFDVVNKGNQLQLLGEQQIVAIAKTVLEEPSDEEKEFDYQKEETRNIVYRVVPNSPFAIETIGELNQVLSGSQYDEIYTTELAKERAEYENWKVARINDNLTINCLMIPWLEGNEKVEYQLQKTNEINEYIIKQITGSVSTWQQSITMQKFYPLYPE